MDGVWTAKTTANSYQNLPP